MVNLVIISESIYRGEVNAMSDVRIRRAAANDQAAIKQMVRDEHLDPSALDWSHFQVAQVADEIVGIAQIRPYPKCRELGSLIVKAPYRKTGVGALLVNALLEQEAGDVYLECQIKNEPYYSRFGFTTIPWYQAPPPLKYKSFIGGVLLRVFGIHIISMKRESPTLASTTKQKR